MNLLKQLVAARWFPTVTKPIISGLVASGVIVALRALGITQVVPAEVNAVVAPLVGFLVTAIVQRAGTTTNIGTVQVQTTVASHTVAYKPGATLGATIAHTLFDEVAHEIDSDPTLVRSVAAEALGRILEGTTTHASEATAQAAQAAREVVTTGNEAPHTN